MRIGWLVTSEPEDKPDFEWLLSNPDGIALYPMSLYIYEHDGTHGGPIMIKSEGQLNGPGTKLIIRMSVKEGREVVITDPGESTLFHAKDGKILFPEQKEREVLCRQNS